jgi:hypothetical protein
MDGTVAIGVSTAFARADHVHPVDTSRYAASNPSGYQTAAQVSAVVPVASATAPVMDGVAAVGVATGWSRGDHVHPVDTSRFAVAGGTVAGPLTVTGGTTLTTLGTTGLIQCSNGRIISQNASATPSVTVFDTAGSAYGIWANASLFVFGSLTAAGVPVAAAMALNATNDLTVNGNLWATGVSSFGLSKVGTDNRLNMIPGNYWAQTATGGSMSWITPSGSVWVMRNTDNACLALLNYVAGNGAYQNISDERIKYDIAPSAVGLDAILKLQPKTFKRIAYQGKSGPDRQELGFIAQDLLPHIPEAVEQIGVDLPDGTVTFGSDNPTLSVSLDPIVAALVNAVRTLDGRLIALGG